jgi:hypothetical protein
MPSGLTGLPLAPCGRMRLQEKENLVLQFDVWGVELVLASCQACGVDGDQFSGGARPVSL